MGAHRSSRQWTKKTMDGPLVTGRKKHPSMMGGTITGPALLNANNLLTHPTELLVALLIITAVLHIQCEGATTQHTTDGNSAETAAVLSQH